MYNVPDNQDNMAESEFKKVLLEYEESLNLFKKYYKLLYRDGSRSMGQISVPIETFIKCELLIESINDILKGKQKTFFKVYSERLSDYYISVSSIIRNAMNIILNTPNGVIQQIPRPLNSTNDTSGCEALESPERKLSISSSTIKKLNCISVTIDIVYEIFKNYCFI